MTNAEREAALQRESVEYADARARAGIWPRDEALARAQEEIRGLVGPRPAERGHEFLVGRDAAGRRIGRIWLDPVPSPGPFLDTRWLFQIVVDSPLRGHGFGRALLRAAEEHVVESGHAELALNVFRWNTAAVALYTGSECGIAFQDDQALELRKRLRPA